MTSTLISKGADRTVSAYDLTLVPTPAGTRTWFPVPHATVAAETRRALVQAGYVIRSERWTLAKHDQRLFGVLDLAVPLARWDTPGGGATVSLGIRSSFDKRLPLGIVAGSRVLVCSNLAFAGEISYKRKHTRQGLDDFRQQVESAIVRLPQYQAMESARFESWMSHELSTVQRDALILALIDSGVIGMRSVRAVLDELKKPTYDDFGDRITVWSTFNLITTALRNRAEERALEHSLQTSRLVEAMDTVIEPTVRVRSADILLPLPRLALGAE